MMILYLHKSYTYYDWVIAQPPTTIEVFFFPDGSGAHALPGQSVSLFGESIIGSDIM